MNKSIFTILTALLFIGCAHHSKHEGKEGHAEMSCMGGSEGYSCQHEKHEGGHMCSDKSKCDHKKHEGAEMCSGHHKDQKHSMMKLESLQSVLNPTKGNKAEGELKLNFKEGKWVVTGTIKGLPKNKDLGFHIHEVGNCSASDGSSAGGHFNPFEKAHGDLNSKDRHVGDMGNIKTDKNGVANLNITLEGYCAHFGQKILGRSFVVHGGMDDLKSQPSGNSGPRLACGIISRSEP